MFTAPNGNRSVAVPAKASPNEEMKCFNENLVIVIRNMDYNDWHA